MFVYTSGPPREPQLRPAPRRTSAPPFTAIVQRDERGRTIDIHALRHTFGTHLSKGGVPLRTAQAAMRHSTPTLTANVYTDPKLLDVRGALNVLPMLPLGEPLQKQKAKATGRSGAACQNDASVIASVIALKTGKTGTSGGRSDHEGVLCPDRGLRSEAVASGRSGNRNGSQSTPDHEPASIGATGFEPATSWTQTRRSNPS